MRRAEREVVDKAELERLLTEAPVMRLGMVDHGQPYVVPVNFAFANDIVWIHGAREGRKMDCLREQPRVCVEVDRLFHVTTGPKACSDWGSVYESVIGFGLAEIVEDVRVKSEGLRALMNKYSGREDWEFAHMSVDSCDVIRITFDTLTGKRA